MKNIPMTSARKDWETPHALFDELNAEFGFTLDAAANSKNKKCDRYFNRRQNGLIRFWSGIVWVNPPFGREIDKWVKKAHREWKRGCTVVMLIPARTDTRWFHKYILGQAEIRFLKGRLVFVGARYNAPFPSMVVVFRATADVKVEGICHKI